MDIGTPGSRVNELLREFDREEGREESREIDRARWSEAIRRSVVLDMVERGGGGV